MSHAGAEKPAATLERVRSTASCSKSEYDESRMTAAGSSPSLPPPWSSAPPRHIRRLLTSQVRHPRPELLQAAEVADDVLEGVDRVTLASGRHLRRHRALRLGAVGYLLLLHGWVVVLLIHLMPSMPVVEPRAVCSVPA